MRRVLSYPPVRSGLLIFLGSFALLWPAMINGGPFWFPDTSNYVRAADAAVVHATGQRSEWSDRLAIVANDADGALSPGEASPIETSQLKPTRPVYSGRSIYYGFFLFLPMIVLGAWGAIFLQALIVTGVSFCLARILARELGLAASPKFAWAGGVLVLATPLPFYTSMLMPDVYSGLLILALGLAIAFFDRLSRLEKWTLVLASALFATFHTTHLLIAVAIGAAALLISVVTRKQLRRVFVAIPVIAIGAASVVLFNLAVQMALNEKPFSPPFLSARITAAGPGTDYLKRNCTSGAEPFVLCRHRNRLPLESDSFLWSDEPRHGLFQMLEREEQLAIARQDRSFFLATLADDPLAFTQAAAIASLEQLVSFDLENFNYPDWRTEALFEKYPPSIARAIEETRATERTMPVMPSVWLSVASSLAALGVIAACAVRARRAKDGQHSNELWYFITLVLLAVLANAAICGALSGPHARYQMRLIWVLPLIASFALISRRQAAAAPAQSVLRPGDRT